MHYRTDIDGLRALAVLLVIINHFGFGFEGGFIGVDVFFVISGFVITLGIYPQILAKNFRYNNFWYKRIRRLMPVLFAVLATSLIVFTLILTPHDMALFLKSVIAVNFSLSNIYLWREYGGYFEGSSQLAPMLHTWSLSVEEQFYFFWPITLVLLHKWLPSKWLMATLFLGFIISIYISQLGALKTISAAYYLMPTRFFELLCGAMLAILLTGNNVKLHSMARHVLSVAGLLLILMAAKWLNEESVFPGLNALYPVLGTAFLIVSANGIINRFLSLSPLVFIGKMSYSLYLWHWPVLVLIVYTGYDQLPHKIYAVIIVTVLSFFSWNYIENPFRVKKYASFRHVFMRLYALPCTIIILFCIAGIYSNGFAFRFDKKLLLMDEALHSDPNKNGCLSTYRNFDDTLKASCQTHPEKAHGEQPIKVLLIGDSHANHLNGFLSKMAEEKSYSLDEYTLNTCLPLFDIHYGRGKFQYERCRQRNDLIKLLIKNSYEYVVLSAIWPRKENPYFYSDSGAHIVDVTTKTTLIEHALKNTIDYIHRTGSHVILIEDTPGTGNLKHTCPIKKELFNKALNCAATTYPNTWFSELLSRQDSTRFTAINLKETLCDDDLCAIDINGVPLYRDSGHLNRIGSELIGELFLQKHGNIFDLTGNQSH